MVAGNPKKMPNPLRYQQQPGVTFENTMRNPVYQQGSAPAAMVNVVSPGDPLSGLQSLVNNINTIRNDWSANKPASNPWQNLPNWRAPAPTPAWTPQAAPTIASNLMNQASTIQAGNAAVDAGRAWKLDGGNGQMPTFLPRNPMEQVRDQFMQTHVFGAKDKALSRNFGPQQMGYIDDNGQMTATNRLGMLRRLAASDPNNEQVKNALAGAEEMNRQNMEARRAKIPEYQAKAAARNDAKRARAMRQADAMRARMGIGPRTSGKEAPANPITSGVKGPLTIENQLELEGRVSSRTGSDSFLGANVENDVTELNSRVRARLQENPNSDFSDETLRAWQQHAAEAKKLSSPGRDMLAVSPGVMTAREDIESAKMWKELADLPDNERARRDWLNRYKALPGEVRKNDTPLQSQPWRNM